MCSRVSNALLLKLVDFTNLLITIVVNICAFFSAKFKLFMGYISVGVKGAWIIIHNSQFIISWR